MPLDGEEGGPQGRGQVLHASFLGRHQSFRPCSIRRHHHAQKPKATSVFGALLVARGSFSLVCCQPWGWQRGGACNALSAQCRTRKAPSGAVCLQVLVWRCAMASTCVVALVADTRSGLAFLGLPTIEDGKQRRGSRALARDVGQFVMHLLGYQRHMMSTCCCCATACHVASWWSRKAVGRCGLRRWLTVSSCSAVCRHGRWMHSRRQPG